MKGVNDNLQTPEYIIKAMAEQWGHYLTTGVPFKSNKNQQTLFEKYDYENTNI